jgi:excisionase family DNA binding protein
MDDSPFLTVQEVAARLRMNPETIRRWLRQGKLQGRMFGGDRGGYRIAEAEVQRFIAESKRAA